MTLRLWAACAAAILGLHAPSASALDEAALRAALPDDVPEEAVLKTWPGVADRTLVAWTDDADAAGDAVDLGVLVVRTSTGEVLQRTREARAFASEAVQFDHIELDTAGYALAPGVRAFGVRIFARHLGYVAEDTTTLLLFEPDGAALRRVLALQTLGHLATRDCGEGHDVARSVAIGRTTTRGHADLVVHERSEATPDGSAHPDRCHPAIRRSERTVTLRFDGARYAGLPR
jgi:hypothetical protein